MNNSIIIDKIRVLKVYKDAFNSLDLTDDEIDCFCHFFFKSSISEEIDSLIETGLEDFIENYLEDYRAEMEQGKHDDDAYERFRQKQIDGEV